MAKTVSSAPSAGSSRDQQQPSSGRAAANALRLKYSTQQQTPSSSAAMLPQCKVKRNYACSKCAYYTQNPRSFLHHQKNVHAERLKVYECSHCLYASKHSQKLQRHVQMVHHGNKGKGHGNKGDNNNKRLLVPPVRIRVQRLEKYAEQQLGELVIVEDVDADGDGAAAEDQQQQQEEEDDELVGDEEDMEADMEAETDGREDDVEEVEEDETDEGPNDGSDDASADQDECSTDVASPREPTPPPPPPPKQTPSAPKHKKQYKVEKQSATFIRCSVCPFGSHSQTLVNRHEKTAHLKKKFFRCMKCNYVTHMRARYTKHVKYHTMPMIKCDDCDFRTPYKWNLDRHNRNHSTVTPGTYKCSHCSFSADIKQSLTVHETNHHVPPVGGVFPVAGAHRRRYRVGASDAPGSAVAGTEIVTYETTKDGGIVEIMTETKSATPTAVTGASSKSAVQVTKSGGATVVSKKTSSSTLTFATANSASPQPSSAAATKATTSPTNNHKSETTRSKEDGAGGSGSGNKPNRRPLPKLIPIAEQQQQQQQRSMIVRLQNPASSSSSPVRGNAARAQTSSPVVNAAAANEDYYSNVTAGQSALSDFASLIDDQYDQDGGSGSAFNGGGAVVATLVNGNVTDRRGTSPKSKAASFFDKLKAKVDETADLTCSVCRYESKCLSEFMRHQRTHDGGNYYADDEVIDHNVKTENVTITPLQRPQQQPPPPVTAAELKSTRCQRCRKRCKTSAELVVHLATCRGPSDLSAAVNAGAGQSASVSTTDVGDDQETQQHPMENKIFVWNTAAVSTPRAGEDGDEDDRHSVTVTPVTEVSTISPEPALPAEQRNEDEEEEDDEEDEDDLQNEYYPSAAMLLKQQQQQQQHQHVIRKEGKMYKTVFKCPHCTFWAATASRFHVHIVGHLNRKPFECSCCAYRSNWRWDITKHIRLKSARRSGADENSAAAANSHIGAKVLMTDETGRRNYSKYNKYLTVMEMDIADGADKAAGGDCEDGKGVASRKSVGGGITRKRRTAAMVAGKGQALTKPPQQVLQALTSKNFKTGTTVTRNNQKIAAKPSPLPLPPPSAASAGGDNRSKTVWKCKKCFFRDCDRLTVLNHVKAHYRRGEFGGSAAQVTSRQNVSQSSNGNDSTATSISNTTVATGTVVNSAANKNQNNVDMKKSTEPDERRKTKIPTTGTTADASLLMLSTNPQSRMLYDAENFLSCPLCDLTASNPGQLKEHMQRTHIPEETKYRCEYCPFWSEEKKIMLDHMMYAHEMDDGSVNTDVNAADVSDRNEQREDDERESGYSNDTTGNMESFDNGSGDDTTTTSNMEVVFDTSDENIVVVETVECKPDFEDSDILTRNETPTTPSKSSVNSSASSTAADDKMNIMISCEYEDGEERGDDEPMDDEEIIVGAEEGSGSTELNLKIVKAVGSPETPTTSARYDPTGPTFNGLQLYECKECWYFSTNKRDVLAHMQLHVKRGALYNCAQCVFNVTKSSVLYHHYRYGHVVEEPELRYPEDAVVRVGQREIVSKNSDEQQRMLQDDKSDAAAAVPDDALGPPMVWTYNKDNVPPFAKVFKCRYCPHTNRRRHNTVEHERMHSDHPEHQNHRQQQQRAAGSSVVNVPLHPCKRCTYVCNNAGVLASHFKVHSAGYSCAAVGFYDSTILDASQVRALEFVMALERDLLLDKDYGYSGRRTADGGEPSSDSSTGDGVQLDYSKYAELDEPELKFCPYCPARFFFRFDLRCHLRFHKLRGWKHACDCCSFTARSHSHVAAHEIVHRDEYAQRTAELLASGYPVSGHYPRPTEYPASVGDSWSPPLSPGHEQLADEDSQRHRRAKRSRNSGSVDAVDEELPVSVVEKHQEEYDEKTTKRRRRSSTVGVAVKSVHAKPPTPPTQPLLPPPPPPAAKTGVAMKSTTSTHAPAGQSPTAATMPKPVAMKTTSGAILKNIKTTKSSYVRQFTCDMCPGRFFKATALQYHRTLHGGPGIHKCRSCDYAVSTYGNLVRHEAVHKDLPPRKKTKLTLTPKNKGKVTPTKNATLPKTPLPPPPAAIPLAKQPTDDQNNDDEAIDPEFGPSMLGNPDFYYPTTLKNGVSRPKRYKCIKCPSAFDKREQYVVHLTLHGARDKYQCDKCDYSVRYPANYVQHQRKHARDAEIRKNNEQAASRAKMIAEQEAASRAPRVRKRPNAAVQRKPPVVEPVVPAVQLDPRDTVFSNEISDRQTAYELNAAYGPTGVVDGSGQSADLFRCTSCPFECDTRAELDGHCLHHQDMPPAVGPQNSQLPVAAKRTWRRSCRFCSYRTHGISDLEEHTRVHFLRSTGVVLSSMAAAALNGGDKEEGIGVDDHVEFHGKRVVYHRRDAAADVDGNENEDDGKKDATDDGVANGTADDEQVERQDDAKEEAGEEEPFFVFKDCGALAGGDNGRTKRFSPEGQTPLFDVNDNRTATAGKSPSHKQQQQQKQQSQPPVYVRFIDGGKRLEFLDDGPGGEAVDAGGKKKKTKK